MWSMTLKVDPEEELRTARQNKLSWPGAKSKRIACMRLLLLGEIGLTFVSCWVWLESQGQTCQQELQLKNVGACSVLRITTRHLALYYHALEEMVNPTTVKKTGESHS